MCCLVAGAPGAVLAQQSAFPDAGQQADPAPAALPDEQTLEDDGAVIGEVDIRVGDVFDTEDPEENIGVFRFLNLLHLRTRDRVVRNRLLFEPGQPYSPRLLDESERILRSTRFLYDADIHLTRYEDHRVDVEVDTRDVWSLNLGLGLGRAGGVNSTHLEVEDTNLLGTGRELKLSRGTSVDRTTSELRFRDPDVVGSHASLEASYSDNSDGGGWHVVAQRPFFSLDTHWAAGIEALADERVDSRYELGHVRDSFTHESRFFEVFFGLSPGVEEEGETRRWTAGVTYDLHRFRAMDEGAPIGGVPADRTLVYPWLGFEMIQDRFIETHDVDLISRTEDVNLGLSLQARLGFAASELGSDRSQAILSLAAERGWRLGEATLLRVSLLGSGRWGREGAENLEVGLDTRLYWRDFGRHALFARFETRFADNLDPERQLLLGGDNGLRGYPLRYQEGNRSFLVSLEQRFYTGWHLLKLFHVGAAVFADAGRAWFDDPRLGSDLGVLRDVGIGLRLAPSRSNRSGVIHLDVAVPLDGGGDIRSIQWLIKSRNTF